MRFAVTAKSRLGRDEMSRGDLANVPLQRGLIAILRAAEKNDALFEMQRRESRGKKILRAMWEGADPAVWILHGALPSCVPRPDSRERARSSGQSGSGLDFLGEAATAVVPSSASHWPQNLAAIVVLA